jgi:ankyrin repeat protein
MLIDHGADVNAADNSGNTVLHAALKNYDMRDPIGIKILTDHGADINAVNNPRKPVLTTSCFQQLRRGKLRLYKDAT